MSDTTLYFAPATCSRVTLTALEEIGDPFKIELIRFLKGEHKKPNFLKINPKGKVPAIIYDGDALTENLAIISFLNHKYPEARLLPAVSTDIEECHQMADLSFFSSTLHPIVSRIRLPMFFAEGAEAMKSVYDKAVEAMVGSLGVVEARLSDQEWWYGNEWSMCDAYLSWVWFRISGAGFPIEKFPAIQCHYERNNQRPSMKRMMEKDAQFEQQLKDEGLQFVPPPLSKSPKT